MNRVCGAYGDKLLSRCCGWNLVAVTSPCGGYAAVWRHRPHRRGPPPDWYGERGAGLSEVTTCTIAVLVRNRSARALILNRVLFLNTWVLRPPHRRPLGRRGRGAR